MSSVGKFICMVESARSVVEETHEKGGVIVAREVLDFATPMQMVPQPNGAPAIAKACVVTRIDVTQQPVAVGISLQGALIYFLDDLTQVDKDKYVAQIRASRQVVDVKDGGGRILVPGMAPPPGFGRGRG